MMKMKEVWNSIYPYLEDAIDEKDSLPLKTQIVLSLSSFSEYVCFLRIHPIRLMQSVT